MNTEDKYENKPTDKSPDEPKRADEFSDDLLKTKTIKEQDEEKPAKKIRRKASQEQLDHPLHGVKLVDILESLVAHYGWKYLADEVNILCFKVNPTMKVSLKFLRKFKWAREHVEDIYIRMLEKGIEPIRPVK